MPFLYHVIRDMTGAQLSGEGALVGNLAKNKYVTDRGSVCHEVVFVTAELCSGWLRYAGHGLFFLERQRMLPSPR